MKLDPEPRSLTTAPSCLSLGPSPLARHLLTLTSPRLNSISTISLRMGRMPLWCTPRPRRRSSDMCRTCRGEGGGEGRGQRRCGQIPSAGAGLRSPHPHPYLQGHTWGSCRSEPRSRARQRCRKRWTSLFSELVVRSREVRPEACSSQRPRENVKTTTGS